MNGRKVRIGRIGLLCLLFIGAAAFFAPFMVQTKYARTIIEKALSDELGAKIELKQISWRWLPVPHFTRIDAVVSNEQVSLKVPNGSVFPNWMKTLQGTLAIKKIEINNPDIHIKTLISEKKGQKRKRPTLPATQIKVKKGRLVLPLDGALQKLSGHGPPLEISDIEALVIIDPQRVDIEFESTLDFAKNIWAKIGFKFPVQGAGDVKKSELSLKVGAKGVDIAAVREKVLLLYGDTRVAGIVCDIIRKGYAKKAGFSFKGIPDDLKKFEAMTITADLEGANIVLKKIGLNLEDASGMIRIENSVLSGNDLSAGLGSSKGENGNIELGLVGKSKVFKLGVDLEVNLSDLPRVLHNLVKFDKFRNELALVGDVTGRASGHLSLGDTLDNIAVNIQVTGIDGSVNYRRLMRPIKINNGRLQILPKEVKWSDTKGNVGPHLIHDMKGSVAWHDAVLLDMEKLDASFDSSFLFEELKSHPAFQEKLSKIISSIKGPLELTKFKARGVVNGHSVWEYSMLVNADNITFDGPFVNKEVVVKSAVIQADNKKVLISQCALGFENQLVNFNADLKHTNWNNFGGWLELSGRVDNKIAGWVKSKNWIPDLYFPKTPCTLSGLRVSLGKGTTQVKGKIISGIGADDKITTEIDLGISPEKTTINDLSIGTSKESSSFSIKLESLPKESLYVDFKGGLSEQTLNRILEDNKLLTGYIKGSFALMLNKKDQVVSWFKGYAEFSGYKWQTRPFDKIKITHARIEGDGKNADIKDLTLMLNKEHMQAEGDILFSESGIKLEMDVKSDLVSWDNLAGFLKPARKKQSLRQPGPEPAESSSSIVTGNINFNIDKFKYTNEKHLRPSSGKDVPVDYIWDNFAGRIKLMPDGKKTVYLTSAEICGCETTGTLQTPSYFRNLSVLADDDGETFFEKVLPCLGLKFDKIQGPFRLDLSLMGTPGNWEKGRVELTSKDGKLKGMTILIKILSIVNVMDMFNKKVLDRFFTQGFHYTQMDIIGEIRGNVLIIEEAKIKGEGMNLFGSGKVDLGKMELDIIVMVAPLKIIDKAITTIYNLGTGNKKKEKTLITFPVRVKGPIKNPKITPLEVHAVGNAFLKMVKDILALPFKIFRPSTP